MSRSVGLALLFGVEILLWPFCSGIADGSDSSGSASITIEPAFCAIGSLCTLDALRNDLVAGSSSMRIFSEKPWRLEVRLEGPPRRLSDGLELPLSRLLETHPQIPACIAALEPCVVKSGDGSENPQEFTQPWLEVAWALYEHLELGDPPGTYEVTLTGRLLDLAGAPISDFASLTMQFEVVPWVDLVETMLPDIHVPILAGETLGESEVMTVTVASNTSWYLTAALSGELTSEEGVLLSRSGLEVCLGEGPGGGWIGAVSQCMSLAGGPVLLAVGPAPAPFTTAVEEVPILLRAGFEPPIPAGRYGALLEFFVETGEAPP